LRNPKRGVNLFSYLTEFGECLAFSPTEFSTVIPAKHPHKFKNKSLPTDSFWPSRTDYFPGTACKALTENKIRPAHTQTHSHLPHTHTHTHASEERMKSLQLRSTQHLGFIFHYSCAVRHVAYLIIHTAGSGKGMCTQ